MNSKNWFQALEEAGFKNGNIIKCPIRETVLTLQFGSCNCSIPSEDFNSNESEGTSFASNVKILNEQWLTWEEIDNDRDEKCVYKIPLDCFQGYVLTSRLQ